MSTEYFLDKDETISIDERYSMLSLGIDLLDASPSSPDYVEAPEVIPEEMVQILVRGLEDCSYVMSDEDFKKEILAALDSTACLPLEIK